EASGFDPKLRHRPPPHPVPGRMSTSARRRRGDRYRILAEDPSDADSAANTGYTASTGGDFHGCTDQFTAFKEHNDENPASHPHRNSQLSRRHRTSGAERLLGHGLGLGRF